MKIKSLLKASKYIILHPLRSWRVFTPKTKKRLKKLLAVILIVLISIPGYLWYEKKYGDNIPEAEAGWWNDSWMYRKAITVSNSSGGALTDFQVKILDNKDLSADITAGKIQADLDDLRFTDINGIVLPYWIEDATTSSVDVWVKMPSVPTTGATVYFYYGNAQATSEQNGNNVFEFFNDFSGTTIDTSKIAYGGGTITQNNYLTIVNNADAWDEYVYTNQTFAREKVFYAKVKADAGARTMVGWHDLGTGVSYGDQVYALYFNSGSFSVYEDGASKGVVGSYTVGTWYDVKIELKTTGAVYCYKLPADSSWTTLYTSTYSTEDNLKPSLTHYDVTETSYTENWLVSKYASSLPSASTPATEEKGGAPIASWSFDEGTGTTANDSSSNRNNGTLTNMSSTADPNSGWQTEDKCVSGKCLAFDNVNDGVSINNQNFTSLNDYSMCSWINPKGNHLHYTGSIISSGDWNNVHWAFGVDRTNGVLQTRKADGVNSPSWSYTFPTNQWSYACITRSGTSILAYVNGKNIGSYTGVLGSIVSNATNTMIGRETYAGGYFVFNGKIDEPRIYNYARTASQIAKDYNAGLSGMGKANEGTSASIGGKSNKWLTDGLVGHWKMDEASWSGTSGEVKDASGNGNNGTAVNGATTGAGKFGNGGVFDGTDDYVNAGSSSTLEMGTQDWTMGAWAKTADTTSRMRIISRQGTGGYYFMGYGLDNKLYYGIYDGTSAIYQESIDSTNYRDGNWHYYLISIDRDSPTGFKVYMDGLLVATHNPTSVGNVAPVSSNTTIGGYATTQPFNGSIDEARIYNRALSPKEVADLYNYAPGPVGYWNMDDATGTTAKDLSGNNNHGTLTNGPTWTTQGKYGGAVSFDGSDDYVNASNSSNFDISRGVTLNAWVYIDSTDAGYTKGIIAKSSSDSANGFILGHWNGSWMFSVTGNSGFLQTSSGFALSRWIHLSATYDGSQTRLYVDGVSVGSPQTVSGVNNTDPITIGRWIREGAVQRHFDGLIDDVKIYNYARTQKQIVEDMNAGHPAGGSPVGSQVGYWKFDEGNGTTAYNSGSGKPNYNSSLINGTAWTNGGKFGKALDFDGSNDYASLSNPVDLSTDNSISFWFYLKSYPASNKVGIFANSNAQPLQGASGFNTVVYIDSDRILKYLVGSSSGVRTIDSNLTIDTEKWYHVSLVNDKSNSKRKIFINGQLKNSDSYFSNQNFATILLNFYHTEVTYFPTVDYAPMYFDELKVYNYALTDSEIQLDYNQGKSLVLGSKGTESDGKTPSNSASRAYCPPGNVEGNCAPGLNPSPVGEWSLDDGSGTTAKDKSGNNNNGTLTNGPTWVTNGKSGNALSFDGTDDYVNISSSTSMVTQNAITVEGWVNRSNFVDADTLYVLGSQSSTLGYHWLYLYSNSINWQYAYTTSYRAKTATYTFNNDTWYHIAVTHDYTSGSINFYVNGQLISQQSQGTDVPVPVSGKSSKIGTYSGSSHIFQGLIDEVKIYNYARTPAQIAWDYNRGAPVGWWRMDEGQGTTAHDYSGNGNNGTLTNMDPATDWVAGKNNGALDFDGSNDYIDTGTNSSLDLTNSIAVSAWIKPDTLSNYMRIVSKQYTTNETTANSCFQLGIYNNGLWRWSVGSVFDAQAGTAPTVGQWYHFVGTYDRSVAKMYVNGNLIWSGNYSGAIRSAPSNPVSIGASYWSGASYYGFDGQIDDVRIYNYALSAEQVKQVMNEGAVRFK